MKTATNHVDSFPVTHAINCRDADELETLAVLAEIAGDEYEALLDQYRELSLKISEKRTDYLRKVWAYQDLARAMAGMTGGTA